MYKRRFKRKKRKGGTISKNFKDEEILFKAPNGDIHLKPCVHRLKYKDFINPDDMESHINEEDLKIVKLISEIKKQSEVDNNESDI